MNCLSMGNCNGWPAIPTSIPLHVFLEALLLKLSVKKELPGGVRLQEVMCMLCIVLNGAIFIISSREKMTKTNWHLKAAGKTTAGWECMINIVLLKTYLRNWILQTNGF